MSDRNAAYRGLAAEVRMRDGFSPPPEGCQGRPRFYGYCQGRVSVERDGKRYCWRHDPVRIAETAAKARAERLARYKAEEARWEAQERRADLRRNSGIDTLTDQDLQQIMAAGGIWAFLPWKPGETTAHVDD